MGQTDTIEYTPERFREEYGFDPIRMIDLKALMGDSSDNIPGVPGIGEKTAKDLLVRFGTVADIYRDLDALDIKPGVRKKLTEGRESAELSFDLATIRTDAPIDFALESVVWDHDYQPELGAAAGGRCKRTVERAADRGRGGQRRAARARAGGHGGALCRGARARRARHARALRR